MGNKRRCLKHLVILAFINIIILTLVLAFRDFPKYNQPERIKNLKDGILLISILLFDINSLEYAYMKGKGMSIEEIEMKQNNLHTKIIIGIAIVLLVIEVGLTIIF